MQMRQDSIIQHRERVVTDGLLQIQRFRTSLLGMLSLLLFQFLLGMAVNLFVTITRHHPGANAGEFFGGAAQSVFWASTQGPIVLILHAVLGVLLMINSVVILVKSLRLGLRSAPVWAIIGAIGIVAAGFNGASFLSYDHDVKLLPDGCRLRTCRGCVHVAVVCVAFDCET